MAESQPHLSLRRELFQLAWPATLALAVHSLYRLNDQFFVQDLGVEAQAAVAVGSMVNIWFVAFGQLVAVGNLALSARRLGAGEESRARATMRRALGLAAMVGTSVALLAVLGRGQLAELLIPGAEAGSERALFRDYMLWIGCAQAVMLILPSIDSSFMAMKRSRVPLVLESLAIGTNAVLNGILVPRYGVEGAGIATLLSRLGPLLLGMLFLRGAGVFTAGATEPGVGTRILRIGAPAAVAIGIYSLVYQVMLAWTFPHFGAAGRSILGAGFGIESVFFCLYYGVANATAALVGRALGEGAPDRARAVVRLAFGWALALGVFSALAFRFAGRPMVGLFTGEAIARDMNVLYLQVMAWAQPLQAMQLIYEQALIGAGLTAPILRSTGVMNGLRVPVAHALGVWLGYGIPGVLWAINGSTLGKFVWAWLLYRSGRWAEHRV